MILGRQSLIGFLSTDMRNVQSALSKGEFLLVSDVSEAVRLKACGGQASGDTRAGVRLGDMPDPSGEVPSLANRISQKNAISVRRIPEVCHELPLMRWYRILGRADDYNLALSVDHRPNAKDMDVLLHPQDSFRWPSTAELGSCFFSVFGGCVIFF